MHYVGFFVGPALVACGVYATVLMHDLPLTIIGMTCIAFGSGTLFAVLAADLRTRHLEHRAESNSLYTGQCRAERT